MQRAATASAAAAAATVSLLSSCAEGSSCRQYHLRVVMVVLRRSAQMTYQMRSLWMAEISLIVSQTVYRERKSIWNNVVDRWNHWRSKTGRVKQTLTGWSLSQNLTSLPIIYPQYWINRTNEQTKTNVFTPIDSKETFAWARVSKLRSSWPASQLASVAGAVRVIWHRFSHVVKWSCQRHNSSPTQHSWTSLNDEVSNIRSEIWWFV